SDLEPFRGFRNGCSPTLSRAGKRSLLPGSETETLARGQGDTGRPRKWAGAESLLAPLFLPRSRPGAAGKPVPTIRDPRPGNCPAPTVWLHGTRPPHGRSRNAGHTIEPLRYELRRHRDQQREPASQIL